MGGSELIEIRPLSLRVGTCVVHRKQGSESRAFRDAHLYSKKIRTTWTTVPKVANHDS